MLRLKVNRGEIGWFLAIAAISAALGMFVSWRAPGIDRYLRDWLMRARGTLPTPDDIVIVAIDEPSIARYGRFPWARPVSARVVDALAAAQPKSIALDILYTDPTTEADDAVLADSIARAGNVVVAAQLVEAHTPGGANAWLLPIPPITRAAAAVGHVNVSTEAEGIARQVFIRLADDAGAALNAMAVEAVRVGDGNAEESITDLPGAVVVGSRVIPAESGPSPVVLAETGGKSGALHWMRPRRMTIDYLGPAGSFASRTYSFADVAEGRIPAARFRGKYVLVGATAASLGDRVASPFVHLSDVRANQHGTLMPGVEVLANALNTILRSRFYTELPDWLHFVCAALVAAVTLLLLRAAQGRHELLKEAAVLGGVAAGIVVAGHVAFSRFLLFPPLTPAVVSFASAGVLALMQRSLMASARLDAAIAGIGHAGGLAVPSDGLENGEPDSAGLWPHGLEWKARALARLNQRILERSQFVDLALRSVEDGLIIAGTDGRITFANRRAAAILGSSEEVLRGQDLLGRLAEATGAFPAEERRAILNRLLEDRASLDREIAIGTPRPHYYTLRMAAVSAEEAEEENGRGAVRGIVASLSDITRQHELQQTKNDVMALVSHEMRTPLAAIQGMAELLANYDMDAGRRREMNLAIHGEVKRLTRMIGEYLDLTRMEAGKTPLRLSPLRVETLIERTLLLLDPLAAQRHIRLVRRFDPHTPPVVADADLLARAVNNLVSNAIKYTRPENEVAVSTSGDGAAVVIEVADHGCGIPAGDLERIFEKFYRVPRVEDADVPGTGLGLALVREIAEQHGGTVTVRSVLNVGSTFTLRIPARTGAETPTGE